MGLLQNVLGSVKDKASTTKATLISNSAETLALRLAVVGATSHNPSSLPSTRHLSSLLSVSSSAPRATAHAAVEALISRLQTTRSSTVALKCLLVLHALVHRGSFILHDQLSLFLSGRNHLNLSNFRDASSAATWRLSDCVRWYARYLEQILAASRALGHFLFSPACARERRSAAEEIPSLLNADLLREIEALVGVVEEIARWPDGLDLEGESGLVSEVVRLVAEDYCVAVSDLASRIGEFDQRVGCLGFGESVELVCALRRVEGFRERVVELFPLRAKASAVALWRLVKRLREEVVVVEERAMVRVRRTGGSVRLEEERRVNLVRFSSNRYGF